MNQSHPYSTQVLMLKLGFIPPALMAIGEQSTSMLQHHDWHKYAALIIMALFIFTLEVMFAAAARRIYRWEIQRKNQQLANDKTALQSLLEDSTPSQKRKIQAAIDRIVSEQIELTSR